MAAPKKSGPNKRKMITRSHHKIIADLLWDGYSAEEIAKILNLNYQGLCTFIKRGGTVGGLKLIPSRTVNSLRMREITLFLTDLGFTLQEIGDYIGVKRRRVGVLRNYLSAEECSRQPKELGAILIEITADDLVDTRNNLILPGVYRATPTRSGIDLELHDTTGIPYGYRSRHVKRGYLHGRSRLVGSLAVKTMTHSRSRKTLEAIARKQTESAADVGNQ